MNKTNIFFVVQSLPANGVSEVRATFKNKRSAVNYAARHTLKGVKNNTVDLNLVVDKYRDGAFVNRCDFVRNLAGINQTTGDVVSSAVARVSVSMAKSGRMPFFRWR